MAAIHSSTSRSWPVDTTRADRVASAEACLRKRLTWPKRDSDTRNGVSFEVNSSEPHCASVHVEYSCTAVTVSESSISSSAVSKLLLIRSRSVNNQCIFDSVIQLN